MEIRIDRSIIGIELHYPIFSKYRCNKFEKIFSMIVYPNEREREIVLLGFIVMLPTFVIISDGSKALCSKHLFILLSYSYRSYSPTVQWLFTYTLTKHQKSVFKITHWLFTFMLMPCLKWKLIRRKSRMSLA